MKKLMGMFKGMPPELRMFVAMAGLGTPLGAIYLLQRFVFKGVPLFFIIIGVAVVVGALLLVGFLVNRLWGRSARKRQKKMEGELASGAEAGPVSMDLRAAVKSNNEKFFGAIKDMRKLGISVYDLPWYIVIGDSGCGKTKLVNEGGLTFSTGKPEGYQLGTLNYNWWFTEDAIFVDMAGRLCNPQDDADHREWQSFLKTVGAGRKGYPINGAICCVSAEHLLQDSPENLEQDANTMLERLRDLQSKLGVTFATYLVITKCDKIVGFMQFFDRAERDITIKNQMFGWSKPTGFDELYDPERFSEDFDGVYARLNELRLRRLNDDVDELELGMAYGFPEEFAQLREPLQIYVRALFPMIKNPRAVKNLIFRGLYFTSATQQGSLILRHLTDRLGTDAAGQFPPLESLYPRPRPHFVKDMLIRKVFPEHGLVFRNEQEVVRNRKLSRLLTIASAAVSVVLILLLVISAVKFGSLISEPSVRANQSPQLAAKPVEALEHVGKLAADVDTLKGSMWPTILSLGIGASQPVKDLTKIQLLLFEESGLRSRLEGVDDGLRTAEIVSDEQPGQGGVPLTAYLESLNEYIAWYGCADGESLPEHLDHASFERLGAITRAAGLPDAQGKRAEMISEQAPRYFTEIHTRDWHNPARILTEPGLDGRTLDPPGTIQAAIFRLHDYMRRYAVLNETHPNDVVREWARIRDACARIEESYAQMLGAVSGQLTTRQQLEDLATTFSENFKIFNDSVAELEWRLKPASGFLRIAMIRDALLVERERWLAQQSAMREAYATCNEAAGDNPNDPVLVAIDALSTGMDTQLRGLDRMLADSIQAAGLADRGYFEGYFDDAFHQLVKEVDAAYGHIFTIVRAGDAPDDDALELTVQLTGTVHPTLKQVAARLGKLGAGSLGADTPADWIAEIKDLLYGEEDEGPTTIDASRFGELHARWRPQQLANLSTAYEELLLKGRGTLLLRSIESSLADVGPWGIGELQPEWRDMRRSAYYIAPPVTARPQPEPVRPPDEDGEPEESTSSRRPGGPPPLTGRTRPPDPTAVKPPPEEETAEPAPEVAVSGAIQIPQCASPEFLNARAGECVQLMRFLADFGSEFYLAEASDTTPFNDRCARMIEQAWQDYTQAYVRAWSDAYGAKRLEELDKVGLWNGGWESFAAQFHVAAGARSSARNSVRDEIEPALSEILHSLRWATYMPDSGWWLEEPDDFYGRQKRIVAEAYSAALQSNWSHGDFARQANAGRGLAQNVMPWDALAAQVATRWENWANAIGRAAVLPREFDRDAGAGGALKIPWGEMAALRDEAGLRDEALSQQFVEFERQAQNLLDRELTNIYHGIQGRFLANENPYDGWPYVNASGVGLTALETVNFDQFVSFLAAVQRADAALGQLDNGLPDTPTRQRRRAFVSACADWQKFIGNPTPLDVEVWNDDPLVEPKGQKRVDDRAQFYYQKVRLSLGLRLQQAGATALEFRTMERGAARAVQTVWEWRRPQLQELTFEAVDGIQPEGRDFRYPRVSPDTLGAPSPLALCAYLHRYGHYADGNWVVSHGINLTEKFREAGQERLLTNVPTDKRVVGEKFIFRLPPGRGLPAPIQRLSPAGG